MSIMRHTPQRTPTSNRQTGATLIVALLLVVVILLTGLAAMNNSGSQFKLAANAQFESLALNRAETAIATAEDWLSTGTNFSSNGFTTYSAAITPHLHPAGRIASLASPNNNPLTMDWSANALAVGGDTAQSYMVELLSKNNRLQGSSAAIIPHAVTGCNQVNIYRITARGLAARNAVKVVQTIYSVKSC
jgi:Tfp pilus assembly protein PilX